jgi:hypothetical protein
MKSILFSTFIFSTIIGSIYGRIVNFSLITFGSQVTVTIGDNVVQLNPVDNFSRVFSVSATCPDEVFQYTYTVDGNLEGFTRTLPAGELSTHNEFFGRQETISPLKDLGYPADKPQWVRSLGKTETFDDSYIPTVILDSGSREYFINGNDTYTLGRFTIILKDSIFTETNVPTKAQNRYEDKFQWRIKLQNKLNKRKVFKFRASPNDPVFYRQCLYADVIRAIGNPVHNQIIVRAYLDDGTPIGLFVMIEVTASNSFIKSQFYGNENSGKIHAPKELGYSLDCGMGTDFVPGGDYSAIKFEEGQSSERFGLLSSAMDALDTNDAEAVKQFSKEWFDVDIFLKFMAMEYLTAHWDSYWMLETNFVLYDDPLESGNGKYKFYFIDQDYDLTFGLNIPEELNTVGNDFPTQSYKDLVNANLQLNQSVKTNRVAIDKFLKQGVTVQMFENHLIDIVKHVFNPVALGRRIEEYNRRYASEIEWDYSIERLHIGADPLKTRYVWNYNDYLENLESTPKLSTPWGLKQWIDMRAESVAAEFGFEWDAVPLEPAPKVIPEDTSVKDDDDDDSKSNASSSKIEMNLSIMFITLTFIIFEFFI